MQAMCPYCAVHACVHTVLCVQAMYPLCCTNVHCAVHAGHGSVIFQQPRAAQVYSILHPGLGRPGAQPHQEGAGREGANLCPASSEALAGAAV